MKRYILLRDNEEKGPYELEELQELGLYRQDLIWVEGQSTCWDYAQDFPELALLVRETPAHTMERKVVREDQPPPSRVFVSLPTGRTRTSESAPQPEIEREPEPSLEVKYSMSLDELKDQYIDRYFERKANTRKFQINKQVGWFAVLFCLLLAGAAIIKKVVESFDEGALVPQTTATAQPLNLGDDVDLLPAPAASDGIENAVTKEVVVAADTVAVAKVKKPKPKALNRSVSITSNEYKTGVFGGISDLRLTVKNNSSYLVDKVTVEVEYLKPKGESVGKETFQLKQIPAHGFKTLSVPPSKRGVKVRYHILKIQSRAHRDALLMSVE